MGADTYIQFVLALIAVLALIGTLAWLARRFGYGVPSAAGKRGQRRLGVVEVAAVDAKRRLVLIRRDATEHLVLLGPNSETLIEAGIRNGGQAPALPHPGGGGEAEEPE